MTKIPPRWLIRILWRLHRVVVDASGGRAGLALPSERRTGMLRLHTVGRKSGKPRAVLLNYITDGENMVALASNAAAPYDPAWWLNLQARPEATVDLPGGPVTVHAREAVGPERERLLAALRGRAMYDNGQLDQVLALRGRHTAVVVLAP